MAEYIFIAMIVFVMRLNFEPHTQNPANHLKCGLLAAVCWPIIAFWLLAMLLAKLIVEWGMK